MRRSPLKRGAKALERRTRLPTANPRRKARLRAEQFGPEGEWMRELPCCTCPRLPPSDPSHVRTRNAGGKRAHLVPQCRECHDELHDDGAQTFESRRPGCSLAALAEEYARRWRELPAAVRERYNQLFRERWPAAARVLDEKGAW